ncbi:MAG: hypothetical protein KDB06_02610 [Ilumatobacter sp.]|nr:hypothetical protein [Ilumatobacter sp.]MCB0983519.1 hypothetical protein [Ilumatobacter sp.]
MYGAHIRIEFHPTYADQFSRLVDDPDTLEVAGEVNGLVVALEEHGRLIEHTEVGHPIVIARYDIHTLRRTPPNDVCPYADAPPVIRIFYAWFTDMTTNEEFPVVFEMGDKSLSPTPNQWYPPIINRIETQTIPQWERMHPAHRARIRRTR